MAFFKKDGAYFIAEESAKNHYHSFPANHIDLNSFMFANPEITHFTDINWEVNLLYEELDKHVEKHLALNLFLMGMDSTFSVEIRKEAMYASVIILIKSCLLCQGLLILSLLRKVYLFYSLVLEL